MKCEVISSLAAAAPRGFKVLFLILIALVIPAFFLLTWLMSRGRKEKKKPDPDKKNPW
jgi:hypothetical protein